MANPIGVNSTSPSLQEGSIQNAPSEISWQGRVWKVLETAGRYLLVASYILDNFVLRTNSFDTASNLFKLMKGELRIIDLTLADKEYRALVFISDLVAINPSWVGVEQLHKAIFAKNFDMAAHLVGSVKVDPGEKRKYEEDPGFVELMKNACRDLGEEYNFEREETGKERSVVKEHFVVLDAFSLVRYNAICTELKKKEGTPSIPKAKKRAERIVGQLKEALNSQGASQPTIS